MVFIRVLGSIEAEANQTPIPLGGPRQRAVLALLVVARGQVVSVDRLIEDLWGGQPPAQALKTLQSYVSNLRRLLEAGRIPRSPAQLLVSAAPGYALRLPEDTVDAFRFERLCRQARDAMTDRPHEARSLLDLALSLWRGRAFAEVADEPWAASEVRRLEELRLSARELRVAAALRTGDVLGAKLEAERLTAEEPLREEGWRLSALARWQEGRQGDALSALRQARSILAAELGLSPGPALVDLEDAILHQRTDVLCTATRAAVDSPAPETAHPLPLIPAAPVNFFGRTAELSHLSETAAEVTVHGLRVALITGEAGMGKSALMATFGADPLTMLALVPPWPG
jgi:DNA-binding SARP family transcriptional activator